MTEIWVRFGEAPAGGRSRNDETDRLEAGVSAYRANINDDGDILDLIVPNVGSSTTAMRLADARPAYRIEGEQLGIGGDGEPVVAVTACMLLDGLEAVRYCVDAVDA